MPSPLRQKNNTNAKSQLLFPLVTRSFLLFENGCWCQLKPKSDWKLKTFLLPLPHETVTVVHNSWNDDARGSDHELWSCTSPWQASHERRQFDGGGKAKSKSARKSIKIQRKLIDRTHLKSDRHPVNRDWISPFLQRYCNKATMM